MLQHLYIKNYVLIQEISLELVDSFNVFTGETGAGKSLLVDALNFVCGQRSSASIVGKYADKTFVEATFLSNPKSIFTLKLIELGYLEDVHDQVIISREMSMDGRNICRINGRSANVSTVRDVMELTLDIHSQFETQYLMRPKHQLVLLDRFMNNNSLIENYVQSYTQYQECLVKLETIKNTVMNADELDFAKSQLTEIDAFGPSVEDYETVNTTLHQLENFEKTKSQLNEIQTVLRGDSDVLGMLYAIRHLFDAYPTLKESFNDAYYRLEDVAMEVSSINNSFVFDEVSYDTLQTRNYKYNQLIRKYGSLGRIIDKQDELRARIAAVEHQDLLVEDCEIELKALEASLSKDASSLTDARKKAAGKLETAIVAHCRDLMLESVQFKVVFEDTDYTQTGNATAHFHVSMNKGERLAPLGSVASGGELSRVMLAMKVIFSQLQGITTLVFDEIDTGVSGKVSFKIGEKMRAIGKRIQVLTITHYSTVAACAVNHYLIRKHEDKKGTTTSVHRLDLEQRIDQLAMMMSGSEDEAARSAAQQLFEQGQAV